MYKFKFADIGEGLHEGVVAEIHVKKGQKVEEGDSLFSVETDKVTSDIPAPATGTIDQILIEVGQTIHVGDEIFHIETGEAHEEAPKKEEEAASVVGSIEVSDKLFSFELFGKNTPAAIAARNNNKKTTMQNIVGKRPIDLNSINPTGDGEAVDVVVIGGGPAGYKAAATLGKAGLKVVNIEKEAFGGTCVNIGCIPVKTLIKVTKVLKHIKESEKYGITLDLSTIGADVPAINKKRWEVSNTLAAGAEMVVKSAKVETIKGEADVIDLHNVTVGDRKFTTKLIFLATGAVPRVINLPGFDEGYKAGHVIDSTIGLDLKALPKTLVVIGGVDDGGPAIDVNFTQILSEFGVKVTLIKQAPAILNAFDSSMQNLAMESLKKVGAEVILNAEVIKWENNEIHYKVDNKDEILKIGSDAVLAATGRDALVTGFAEKLGLKTNERGFVNTNSFFQTNVPTVFAVGDISGKYLLAHEAFRQGVVAAKYVLGKESKYKQNLVPRVAYAVPEIASVGYTEEELKKLNIPYVKGEWSQQYVGKSVADSETDGMTKILVDKEYGKILGVHMMNSTAIDAINEATSFMELEGTIEELVSMVHPHPATSESIWDAALVAHDAFKKAKK